MYLHLTYKPMRYLQLIISRVTTKFLGKFLSSLLRRSKFSASTVGSSNRNHKSLEVMSCAVAVDFGKGRGN